MVKLLITPDNSTINFFLKNHNFKKNDSYDDYEIYVLDEVNEFIVLIIKDLIDLENILIDTLKNYSVDLVFFIGFSLALRSDMETLEIILIDRFSVLPQTMVLWDHSNISNFKSNVSNPEEIVGYENSMKNLCLASTRSEVSNWKVKDWIYNKFDISLFDKYGAYIADICDKSNIAYIVCSGVLVKKTRFNLLTKMIDWNARYSFFELLMAPYRIPLYMILYYRRRVIFKKFNHLIENFMRYKN